MHDKPVLVPSFFLFDSFLLYINLLYLGAMSYLRVQVSCDRETA